MQHPVKYVDYNGKNMKQLLIGIGVVIVCLTTLLSLDRFFFKNNKSFCLRLIYSTLPFNPDWELPPLSAEEKQTVEKVLNQNFHYLNKGGQTFAFSSDDGKYVIKFCRFPSSLRPFSWTSSTFTKFKPSNVQMAKKSLAKLHNSFHSYKLAFQELKEETGLLYVHLNPSHDLKKIITIIDKLGAHYQIPLDHVTFILQKKADLVYPALENYKINQDKASTKQAIGHLVDLFIASANKGIVDYDAIMHKNYGFIENRAIHIDIGNFGKNEEIKEQKRAVAHVLEMTNSLKKRLEKFYPDFFPLYDEVIQEKLLPENSKDL